MYGRLYEKQAKALAEILLQVLKKLRVEYTVKASEYSIKCVLTSNHHNKRRSSLEQGHHSEMVP
jgi:hypothetical protein